MMLPRPLIRRPTFTRSPTDPTHHAPRSTLLSSHRIDLVLMTMPSTRTLYQHHLGIRSTAASHSPEAPTIPMLCWRVDQRSLSSAAGYFRRPRPAPALQGQQYIVHSVTISAGSSTDELPYPSSLGPRDVRIEDWQTFRNYLRRRITLRPVTSRSSTGSLPPKMSGTASGAPSLNRMRRTTPDLSTAIRPTPRRSSSRSALRQ